ncbi:hypothetical protein CEE45_09560 [Candidatus Heimdallarchaeota archaeon B3_Heim]|nr:MAG: hypothetical protein CEE45_09560 [Candidatus Heimdallarchaeota archaeon B3_Heim]
MYDLKQKGEEFSTLLVPALVKIIRTLQLHGKEVFIIGGAVRDFLCGHQVKDFDVATNAVPEQIIKWLSEVNIKTKPIGGKYGTVLAIKGKNAFDISTYRKETFITYGQPPKITFVDSLDDDLIRRDFRINSILYDPEKSEIIDKYGGWADIQNQSISMIGDPNIRLKEDGLRVIRLARFMSKFNLNPEPEILDAVRLVGDSVKFRSTKVIQIELFKFLRVKDFQKGLMLLFENKILHGIFPHYPFQLAFEDHKHFSFLINNFCSLLISDELARLFGALLLFSDEAQLNESHFERIGENLALSNRQQQLLQRLYVSWKNFPRNKDRNEIKRWVRATGINTSEIVAKIFFLSLLKVEDAVHDQEEEYLKTIQEMVSNLKTGKKIIPAED